MRKIFSILVMCSGLIACGSSENSRYRNTAQLERPPTLALQKLPQNQNIVIDDSVEPKKNASGLEEKVVLLDDHPKKILLKQSISEAWRILGTALRQSDIKITDYEKSKYNYYVSYKVQGVFRNILSALNEEETKTVYLITLVAQDSDTLIQVMLANRNEQSSQNATDNTIHVTDDSDGLVESLYHLLHDEVKVEK